MMYARTADEIEKIHKKKAYYVNNVFLWLALSFVFFILAVVFMLANKV